MSNNDAQKAVTDYVRLISQHRLEIIKTMELIYLDGYITNKGIATISRLIEKQNMDVKKYANVINEVNQRLRNLD